MTGCDVRTQVHAGGSRSCSRAWTRRRSRAARLGVPKVPRAVCRGGGPRGIPLLLRQGGRPAVRPLGGAALVRRDVRAAAAAGLRPQLHAAVPPGALPALPCRGETPPSSPALEAPLLFHLEPLFTVPTKGFCYSRRILLGSLLV